jgi:hypothetical protein
MPPYNKEKIISGRFCRQCDEWFRPTSKFNFYCKKCIKSHQNPFKPKPQKSEELNNFQIKYNLK